ncbi:hypothetical protein ACB092_11G264800 [Castanea dentata]
MDERMKQVAESGDVNAFYLLIEKDVKFLEHIDQLPFVQTPLHIAASAGNIQFAMEMMGLKPSFAQKLNQNGFSPIHIALQNGHIELVRQLLQYDGDLVRVKGRECLTPLHYVVESSEHPDILKEFLSFCPDSIIDVTGRNETVLHIALKYNNLETFKFFVKYLGVNVYENAELHQRFVLNKKDNEGNTVLHIAVSKNQTEAVRYLLFWGYKFVDVNRKNLEGKTAWDILQEQTQEVDNSEIRVMLRDAKSKPKASILLKAFCAHNQRPAYFLWYFVWVLTSIKREMRNLTEERRNILLMVTVLLATLSFQAVLTPPRGLWQDNGQCVNLTEVLGSSHHNGSNHLTPFNITTVGSSNHPVIMHLTRSNTTLACEHKAGTAVALKNPLFELFLFCNSLTFTLSNALMVLLAINGQMKILFFGLHFTLSLSYCYSVGAIMDKPLWGIMSTVDSAEILFLALFYSWKQ